MTDIAPELAALDRILTVIDCAPGPEGRGLSAQARSDLYSFVENPTYERWVELRRMSITPQHTLRLAAMRHGGLTMYEMPTVDQVLHAIVEASVSTHA